MIRPALDLNLIPVLQALVTHKSVTRAALALAMSQPQLSRALARLRLQTGDALLLRAGNGMEPTDTALKLAGAFDTALATATALLAANRAFVPAQAANTFRLSMNDYEAALLLPALFRRSQTAAPGVRLAVISQRPSEVPDALLQGRIELAIGRFTKPAAALRFKPLFDEQLVAAVRTGHPLGRRKPSLANFVAWPHVLVAPGGQGDFRGLLDEQLLQLGSERRVSLSVSQFLVGPWVASQTDAIVVLPQRLLPVVQAWGLHLLPAPVALPRFQVAMLWRERSQREPAHRWLRQAVIDAVPPA